MNCLSHISPICLEPRFASRFLRLPRCKNLVNQENLNKIMVQTYFGTILAERERERVGRFLASLEITAKQKKIKKRLLAASPPTNASVSYTLHVMSSEARHLLKTLPKKIK